MSRLFGNGVGKRGWIVSCALGLFFGASIVLGYSYDQDNGLAPLKENVALSLAVLLVLTLTLSFFFELIYRLIDKLSSKHCKEPGELQCAKFSRRIHAFFEGRYAFPLGALLLFAIWSFWLISFYPGMTDADTNSQILQGLGMASRSDHHPFFDSLIFSRFIVLGQALGSASYGLFAYSCLQLLGCALGFSFLFRKLLSWGCPHMVRVVLFCFVALLPIIPIMALFMMKDSLFAVVALPWMILFADAIITKGATLQHKRVLFAFAAFAFLACMTKKTGVYIVVICCVIAFFWIARRYKLRFVAVVVCALVPFFLWTYVVLPAKGIDQGSSAEMMSIPSQQVARYARSYELTPEEIAGVEAVYSCSPSTLAEQYNPRRSDATKGYWVGGSSSQLLQFGKAYLSMFLKHPGTFISATWNNVYDYFYPAKQIMLGTWPSFEDKYINGMVSRSYEDVTEEEIRAYFNDLIVDMNELLDNPPLARAIFVGFEEVPVLNLLTSEAIYCSWIPFLLVGLAIRRKSVGLFLCALPCLVVLLTLIAGPISLTRYMPASVYGAILLLGILFCRLNPSNKLTVDSSSRLAASRRGL